MKRNHDDDLPTQPNAGELDHNTERAADSKPASVERESEPQPGRVHMSLPDTDEPRATPSQEFDERARYAEPQLEAQWSGGDDHDDSELSAHFGRPSPPKESKRTRRLVTGFALLAVTIGVLVAVFYVLSPSRSVKVNVSTKQPDHTPDGTAKPEKAPDDVTAEAIAEVRSAISKPSASATSSDPATSLLPRGSQNLSAPVNSSVLPSDAADEKPAETISKNPAAREMSRRNQEQSIRFPSDDDQAAIHPVAASRRPDKALSDAASMTHPETSRVSGPNALAPVSRKLSAKPSVAPVVLPSFGSILPVRTLGKIYTLRSGSTIRLELTRYVSGDGWSLSKGTVLIGQVRGSERDRAFIAITGFIEPSRDRLVSFSGEILGDDGGSGIRGKFHKLSNGWSRAFARVGSAAVNVAGAVAGSRISGQPVILTDIGSRTISPFSYEVDSSLLNQARGFVEVPAGTPGFVMVTTLPADVKGIDAEPDLAQSSDTTTAANQTGALTQDEVALLLTSGDTTRIREALPRMSPQMRRIAEAMLAESSLQRPDKE